MMNVLLCFCLLLLLSSYSREETRASEIQFQTLDIPAHLSSSICSRALGNGLTNRASSTVVEVVHKHGPCAPTNIPTIISLADTLVEDQLRVQSIQARVANTNKGLPVRSGQSLGSENYIVTIGLGTPVQNLTLAFDTGSDLTWTQCEPCLYNCYRQKDHIFNPSASTTHSNISCNSPECSELAKYEGGSGCYRNSTCLYRAFYGDGSYTIGFYSRDTFTVTTTDVLLNFRFGCGQNNTGLFGQTAGLLGLARGPASFVSQTESTYSGVFSYCLPSSKSSTGFLSFGAGESNKPNNNNKGKMMVITPLIPSPQAAGFPTSIFYYIEITAISVGGARLKIMESIFKTAGAIIDSGTTITRLPPAAYNVMKKEFKKHMRKYRIAPAYDILDTCFYITTHIAKIPTMSFTFKGNATLDLHPSGILIVVDKKRVCLAFAGNDNPRNLAIFGNTQQLKFEVTYDVPGNQLGFRSNPGCHLQ